MCPFRQLTITTLSALGLLGSVAVAQRPTNLWNSYESDTLFSTPSSIKQGKKLTRISKSVDLLDLSSDVFFITVPAEGELQWTFNRLILEDRKTGKKVKYKETEYRKASWFKAFERNVTVERMGILRQYPVAKVTINREHPVSFEGESYDIREYELDVMYRQDVAKKVSDTGLVSEQFEEYLGAALTGGVPKRAFLAGINESPLPGPTDWQPTYDLSPAMPWLKVPVTKEGLYRIDAKWLRAHGITTLNFSPNELILYTGGSQVTGQVEPGRDGTFAGGASLLFYGTGSESAETVTREYYLGWNPEKSRDYLMIEGPQPSSEGEVVRSVTTSREVSEHVEFHTEVGSFLTIKSMSWLWKEASLKGKTTLPFHLPHLDREGGSIKAHLKLLDKTSRLRNRITIEVTQGKKTLLSKSFDSDSPTVDFEIPMSSIQNGNGEVAVSFSSVNDALLKNPNPWVESLHIEYPKKLILENELLIDSVYTENVEPGLKSFEFFGPEIVDEFVAMDIGNPNIPVRLFPQRESDKLVVTANITASSRILVAPVAAIQPAPQARESFWVDWSDRDKSADVLIIYHPMFEGVVPRHAADLEAAGFETMAVSSDVIYDSFSHGEVSKEAIRNFISMAVYEWTGNRPHSVILYGDSTGDARNVAEQNVPNLIPSPVMDSVRGASGSEFPTDSWYTWLTPDDEMADIFLGRISLADVEEANNVIDKIIAYRQVQDEPTEWGSRLMAVADRGTFEVAVDRLTNQLDTTTEVTKLAANDFAWEDNYYLPSHLLSAKADSKVSPLLTGAIEQAFNDGAAIATYFGHGAPNLWSNQRFWFGGDTPNSDILRLKNGARLPLVTSFTCNNATINYPMRPWNVCIAEDFLRQPNRGAIGTFMPSGPGFLNQHEVLSRGFFHAWSNLDVRTHGVLAEIARLSHQVWWGIDDHSRMYLLLGDPTLKLPPHTSDRNVDVYTANALLASVDELEYQQSTDDLSRTWSVIVQDVQDNQVDNTPQFLAPLTARLYDQDGELVSETIESMSLTRGKAQRKLITMTPPSPGIYQVEFSLPTEHGEFISDRLESAKYSHWVSFGPPQGEIELVPAGSKLDHRGNQNQKSSYTTQFQIYNGSPDNQDIQVEVRLYQDDFEFTATRNLGQLGPGDNRDASFGFTESFDVNKPMMAEVRAVGTDKNEEAIVFFEETIELPSPVYTDVAILPDSIRVSPDRLSDGLTVFVSGTVMNQGEQMTESFRMGLFEAESQDLTKPLENFSESAPLTIPRLLPGEQKDFHLRWDPQNNAGEYSIKVIADYHGALRESDLENNVVEIPLKVKTKSRLSPGTIEIQHGSQFGEAVLIANVENKGETDSGPVAITFYRTQEATEETKIHEMIIDSVPALGSAKATYRWSMTREDALADDTNPSFTVALKGSLLRASSVASDESEAGP